MLERRASQGKEVPALNGQPELFEDLEDIMDAFMALHQSRAYGFGPNPISLESIDAWLRLNEVTDKEDKLDYCYLIRAMDSAWLKWYAKSQETKRKK